MLETSKDVFWIAVSLVIVLGGVFLAMAIYQLMMMLRDFRQITKKFRHTLDLIDQTLTIIKDKTEKTASYLPPIIDGIGKVVGHFQKKDAKKETKRSRKKK